MNNAYMYLSLGIGWVLCILIAALGFLVLRAIWNKDINISRLLSEPNGDASMSRFQLMVFTFVVALSLFLVVVGNGSSTSAQCAGCPHFPDIPGSVLSLLGISASSYLVSKGIQFSNDEGVRERPPSVDITPIAAQMHPGQSQQFTAAVDRADNDTVTWSINPQVGTISQAGLYTAPASIGQSEIQIQVQAVSVVDPQGVGKASIKLMQPPAPATTAAATTTPAPATTPATTTTV